MDMTTIKIRIAIVRAELTVATQWVRESISLLTKAKKYSGVEKDAMLDKAKAADRKATEAISRLERAIEEINEQRHLIRVAIANSREVN